MCNNVPDSGNLKAGMLRHASSVPDSEELEDTVIQAPAIVACNRDVETSENARILQN